MAGNSIGQVFRVTTFGESHGEKMGVVVDGCPAGVPIQLDFIQAQLDKRKPGQSKIVTQRKEADQPEIVAGVFEGRTTGVPLTALFTNAGSRSNDYNEIADKYRPSHADYTYDAKYGHRDHRGGGRSSARETVGRVFAGAVAQTFLQGHGITVQGYVSQVGDVRLKQHYRELNLDLTWNNIVHCPDPATAAEMLALIEKIRKQGDTIGGVVTCVIKGCPAGLGEPVFDRLHADLGKAMLSINAAKGFEYGAGFAGVSMKGSEQNDPFLFEKGQVRTATNYSGGIQGGISNGMDIYFNVAFKPVATIMQRQKTVNKSGEIVDIDGKGRHDPCVLPRAVAIVEAMAAITIADHLLRNRTTRAEGSAR